MALNYVTVTGTFDDGSGSPIPAVGQAAYCLFTPSTAVYASGVPLITPAQPIQAPIINGALSQRLLATDNSGLTFGGLTGFFYWTVSLVIAGQASPAWSFFLPHLPSPVDLSALANTAASGGGATLPLTTLGDTLYENGTPAPARLPGNVTAAKQFLTQTGTGSVSAAPAWAAIAAGDLPAATTSVQGAVILDGTVSDIQPDGVAATGNKGQAADAKHAHPYQPWQFLPESYGAKHDGQVISDASMTSGSAVLTTPGRPAPSAPGLATSGSGGTILAGVYQVVVTYVNAYGETVASASSSTTTSGSTSTITITPPVASGNAVGWYAYVTQAGGSTYTRQQAAGSPGYIFETPSGVSPNLVLTAPPTNTGAQPPVSNTTPSNPFTAGDVGKAIVVNGVSSTQNGSGGWLPISTTIASYQSAGQVTLSVTAGHTNSAQLACWGTDDTAAVNSAVTAATSYATGGGVGSPPNGQPYYAEIIFRPAIYVIAGALTQAGATLGNAQIPLPLVPDARGSAPDLTLAFLGVPTAGVPMYRPNINAPNLYPGINGTVLFSTLTSPAGTGTFGLPSVIGSATDLQGYGGGLGAGWNRVHPVIDGITVIVPPLSTVSGFDFRSCIGLTAPQARAFSFLALEDNAAFNPKSFRSDMGPAGLYTPDSRATLDITIGSFSAAGFNSGLVMGGGTQIAHLLTLFCAYGLAASTNDGDGCTVGFWFTAELNTALAAVGGNVQGPCIVDIASWSCENSMSFWTAGFHIDDPGGQLSGTMHINAATAETAISVNGAANATLIYEGGNGTAVRGARTAPGVPASTTALLNPFWRHAWVAITGGTVSAIAVDGVATGFTLTAGQVIAVRVPSGKTVTLTYTVAPTWTWWLD